MWRNSVLVFALSAGAIASSHAPRAQSDMESYGDLSAIEQIAAPDEMPSADGNKDAADRGGSVDDQDAPVAEDICTPTNEPRRRALGISCVGDTLILPDGSKVDRDAFVLKEDGVYVRISPEEGTTEDETEGILSLLAPSE